MSEAITEATARAREHARIDSTLNWYFNFAEGDVGLQSDHNATVAVLINPKNRTVANADAAEEAMFRAVEAITRHLAISAALARLSERDRCDLFECYAGRRWRGELAERLAAQRSFAASAPVVRSYLAAHGTGWSPEAGEALLVLAQESSSNFVELAALGVEAWSFAERVVEDLFGRYAAAERLVEGKAAAERDPRRTEFRRLTLIGRTTDRRPS